MTKKYGVFHEWFVLAMKEFHDTLNLPIWLSSNFIFQDAVAKAIEAYKVAELEYNRSRAIMDWKQIVKAKCAQRGIECVDLGDKLLVNGKEMVISGIDGLSDRSL